MRNTIKQNKRGIQWTLTERLEDLDFADDIVLLALRHIDMQEKTNDIANNDKQIGLEWNQKNKNKTYADEYIYRSYTSVGQYNQWGYYST